LRVDVTFTNPNEELIIWDITNFPEVQIGIMNDKGDGTYQFRGKGVSDSGEFFTIKVISPSGADDTELVIRK